MRNLRFLAIFALLWCGRAQVYSPVVLKAGQPDASNLRSLAQGIYLQAGAKTPREKAEAIWRFFLTDGRFVKPGFWYHIAGWAYEEPRGEVLDPVKLLNSYGFGLCYHIAPLLSAVWDAGGFEHTRVWFLTGHTVAEVFYDGAYHYFDSDMMGYNPVGAGPVKARPVASVHQIEQNGSIISDQAQRDQPWYPADVRAHAIGDLAALFTTTKDNWLYPFKRYSEGHSMDFVLRPGEKMIRYFQPEGEHTYYLPYKFDGSNWSEFPQEINEYRIRTEDGPRSQKDARLWSTGKIEYRPPVGADTDLVFAMTSPYVIIDAHFELDAKLLEGAETSTDRGRTWISGLVSKGSREGRWTVLPGVIAKSEHGELTAVSGSYGYLVRFLNHSAIRNVVLTTRFQINPRTLPALTPGHNDLVYRAATETRIEYLEPIASKITNATYRSEAGQGFFVNGGHDPGQILFELTAPERGELTGFDAGGRFLDLRDGLAPDKLTAEVRNLTPWPEKDALQPTANLAWSISPSGPFQTVWTYDPRLTWKDGQPIDRLLRWPEVDRHVAVPPGTPRVYVRYEFDGMAIDDFRLAVRRAARPSSPIEITHIWKQNEVLQSRRQTVPASMLAMRYGIETPPSATVVNEAVILECPLKPELHDDVQRPLAPALENRR